MKEILFIKIGCYENYIINANHDGNLYAGASRQTELIKLFLENGARFDIFNRYNGSARIPACERGHVEAVRLNMGSKGLK